jgi:hypothetical protein
MSRSRDDSSAYSAVAITPSDATVLPKTRGIWVGVTGNIAVRMANGESVTFANVPVGLLPIQVDMVKATSTTATTMLALY